MRTYACAHANVWVREWNRVCAHVCVCVCQTIWTKQTHQSSHLTNRPTDRPTNKWIKLEANWSRQYIEQEVVNKTKCHLWLGSNKFPKNNFIINCLIAIDSTAKLTWGARSGSVFMQQQQQQNKTQYRKVEKKYHRRRRRRRRCCRKWWARKREQQRMKLVFNSVINYNTIVNRNVWEK